MFRKQELKQFTTHEKATIHNNFWQTINCLEKYIEVAKYYPDWQGRKQIRNSDMKWKDIIDNPKKAEELFLSQLFALSANLEDTPPFFQEELKKEFHQWIDATGININNCPQRLKHFLFETNEVLEGRSEKIQREIEKSSNSPECIKEILGSFQKSLQEEKRKTEFSLESKSYKDIELINKFNANTELGKKAFEQIAESVVNKHDRFHFFQRERNPNYRFLVDDPSEEFLNSSPTWKICQENSQYWINSQVIKDVKNNPQNWRLDKVFIHVGNQHHSEVVLIHNSAQLIYGPEGNLIFNNNPIYQANRFNQAEIDEINKFLNITSQQNLYQEQNHLASLIKKRKETKDKIQGKIEEVIRLKTWWSNYNVATVINYHESYYRVFVVVYEPPQNDGKIEELLKVFKIDNVYDDLESAKSKASSVRNELNGENPILAVHPAANSYTSFSNIIKEDFVVKVDLPFETRTRIEIIYYPIDTNDRYAWVNRRNIEFEEKYPNQNPEQYLKPLDIVKVGREALGNKFYHFGIYLGGGEVCHYSDPNSKIKTDNNQVRITSWETFVRGCVDGEVIGCHPIIPFKHFQKVAANIAWDEANNYGNLRYCLANNNCEHYVNLRVFGLNYSKQVEERPVLSREKSHYWITTNYEDCNKCKSGIINAGESGNFCLKNKLSKSLSQTDNNRSREIKNQYLQEVPPKEGCWIM